MIPTTLYRESIDGSVFEEKLDAIHQSIDSAATNLFVLLRKEGQNYTESGETLLSLKAELKSAMKALNSALDSKAITEYNKSAV